MLSFFTCRADGVPVVIDLKEENEFRLTKQELLDAITDKTKILVLPFPNNPTGAIMDRKDLEEIAQVIIEKDLYVLSDEIYAELTFTKDVHVSIASLPGMKERTDVYRRCACQYSQSSRDEGAHDFDQWVFQIPCDDRMAVRLLLRSGGNHPSNDQDPSVCDHVRTH